MCFILASYSGCNRLAAILFFSFASGFAGLDNSRVNNMDLSPNYAPTIISIVNSCGSAMGILAPLVVGLLTPNVRKCSTLKHLDNMFIFYVIFIHRPQSTNGGTILYLSKINFPIFRKISGNVSQISWKLQEIDSRYE